jgi:hypothetical protein
MLVRQISIDKLQDEGKKLLQRQGGELGDGNKNPQEALTLMFIKHLMKPKEN